MPRRCVGGAGGRVLFARTVLNTGKFVHGRRGVGQAEHGVVLERDLVVRVPHDALRDLRRDAGARELCAEGGPEGVKIDDTAVLVLATVVGPGPGIVAFSDEALTLRSAQVCRVRGACFVIEPLRNGR